MNTRIHQKDKPSPIAFDTDYHRIVNGSKVAFNRSGEVKKGVLKEVTKNEWKVRRDGVDDKKWWGLDFEAIIEDKDGNTSKIKNPNSFIIIT